MDNNVMLLAPQFILREKLNATLGASPSVTVSEAMETTEDTWNINIYVTTIERALNLSIITKNFYNFSGIKVAINFFVTSCNGDIPIYNQDTFSSLSTVFDIVNDALSDNPFFAFAAIRSSVSKDENDDGAVFIVTIPHVVQYTCNNVADLFNTCSEIAQDAFSDILYDKLFNLVNLYTSTNVTF